MLSNTSGNEIRCRKTFLFAFLSLLSFHYSVCPPSHQECYANSNAAYITQGQRYSIHRWFGCVAPLQSNWVSIALYGVPLLFLGTVSPVYCSASYEFSHLPSDRNSSRLISVMLLMNQRRQIRNTDLATRSSNRSGYIRLVFLSTVGTSCTLILASTILTISASRLGPWRNWDSVHANFSSGEPTSTSWRMALILEMRRWFTVLVAFTYGVTFSLTKEARETYASLFGLRKPRSSQPSVPYSCQS